jgi:AcrR family transcriptional regulator
MPLAEPAVVPAPARLPRQGPSTRSATSSAFVKVRRDKLIRAMILMLRTRPPEAIGMEDLAERAGLTLASVQPLFAHDEIWRAAIGRIMAEMRMEIRRIDGAGSTVHEAVRHYALATSRLVQGVRYLHLMRIVIRDGPAHRWIWESFQSKVAAAIESGLAEAIAEAGKGFGAIRATGDVARRFRVSLEQGITFPQLHPAAEMLDRERRDSIAIEAAKAVVARIFIWESEAGPAAAAQAWPKASDPLRAAR